MGITVVKSTGELLAKSDEVILRARKAGQHVWLIAPSHRWAQQRKLQLRHSAPAGVSILTLPQFVEQMWDLYGDGTKLINAMQRKVLLRPIIKQVGLLDSSASPKLVEQLGGFILEAAGCMGASMDPASLGLGQWQVDLRTAAPDANPSSFPNGPVAAGASFEISESKIMELLALYERKLELEGLTELAQAERELLMLGAGGRKRCVFEDPDLHSAHTRNFLMGLEQYSRVHVFKQRLSPGSASQGGQEPSDELVSLRRHLYTGAGGLKSTGKVHVGISQGAHASAAVIVRLVQEVHESNGVPFGRIVVCPGTTSQAYPRLFDAFAAAGIPFVAHFSLPCARVGLGAAFFALEKISNQAEDDAAFAALVDLASGPYGGIPGPDARALQMRWREQAHSTAGQCLADIRQGFAQGNAGADLMKERLAPLAALIQAPRQERVRLLFEHAQSAGLDADALIDDRAAAEELLDYLEACERFSVHPDASEMANLSVPLSRSFGQANDAVLIQDVQNLGIEPVGAVIMCDLDSAHYPMASQGAPFDAIMSKLGIERTDSLAHDQRLMLLNTLEMCQDAFAFMRSTHDASGDESCQSALFEELVTAYRAPCDDQAGLPVHAVPAALSSQLISLSEADCFFGVSAQGKQTAIMRGSLASPDAAQNLITDLKGNPLPFSPTALEDYYRCPYRWFACRRVGYNGMDVRFDPASQGNLVHAALERFYVDLAQAGHSRVTPENLPLALEIAGAAFDREVELEQARERRGLYLRTRLDECVCEDLRTQVLGLVERDACFLPGFSPRYLELALGSSVDGPLHYAGVLVRGKVDRIDVDQQGNAIIIDYKLSSLASGYGLAKEGGIPKRIQTDIYATLVQRHFSALGEPIRVIGSVYRSYSKNCLRGSYAKGIQWGLLEKVREDLDSLPRTGLSCSYEEYLGQVEEQVAALMDQLRAGRIEPDPIAADVCEYCKAKAFCPKGGA